MFRFPWTTFALCWLYLFTFKCFSLFFWFFSFLHGCLYHFLRRVFISKLLYYITVFFCLFIIFYAIVENYRACYIAFKLSSIHSIIAVSLSNLFLSNKPSLKVVQLRRYFKVVVVIIRVWGRWLGFERRLFRRWWWRVPTLGMSFDWN
jgi:hypothetical protein